MTILKLFGIDNILEYQVMQFLLYKQNILKLYVIMSFENFYLFKSYA